MPKPLNILGFQANLLEYCRFVNLFLLNTLFLINFVYDRNTHIIGSELLAMSIAEGKEKDTFDDESRAMDSTIKAVQNFARADATLKQKPSLWTKNMLTVSSVTGS